MKNLVIVESPNKVNTIKKYLGDDYEVIASVGHFLKMKTSGEYGLGIDFENWEPSYSLERGKSKLVSGIKSALKEAKHVYIATDPDREGEAIGSHIVEYFKIKPEMYSRIKYNEITKDAILKSFEKASVLDEGLVDAQKSRRMLDRIIGFRVSQLIRKKFKNSPGTPTAGRVQSIALKLVVDREKEINAFIPEQYYKLNAKLVNNDVLAMYFNSENISERREWIETKDIDKIKKDFENIDLKLEVINIAKSQRKVGALTPFKQATLYKKSPLSSSSTQSAAQNLYEGYGDGGLISYPRTDSSRMSQTFVNEAHKFIAKKWGKDYIAEEIKGFSGDQDAHEAIRPTDLELTPELAKSKYPEMSESELKVYKLIYENTLMALIKQPIRESKQYTYKTKEYMFKNTYSKIIFDGYYIVTNKELEQNDPNYQLNQIVAVEQFNFEEHETKPAPRYNDGTLIEKLDEIKVGRPSTFASTIKIIKDRAYVNMQGKQLVPTEFGIKVSDSLINAFPDIFNELYTASVEEQLDKIADNELEKNNLMEAFWNKFQVALEQATDKMSVVQFELIELDENCPQCGNKLLIRNNKKGQKFIGCSNFPNCKYTASYEEGNNSSNNDKYDEEEE
ncbi:type I DNA topoisomerase [Mycoplasma sp. CSL7491-lung]|uniref:type I DNA topoisomerase n=1 Tax=Mycoplasma sp. CSL7491-lung TaxID=549718 RepID=UPI001C0FA2EB|nr:type I DNA topoisomerase [Mycoplasma sp. CSL7491-lung]MBU4693072.1 type I DNA topoisomerase [Mycoplasma sp. CSL7491-lung]